MTYMMFALAACGAAGALTYSFPAYLRAISRTPPLNFALITLGFTIFVGSMSAALFTSMVGHRWPWTIEPEPWPLAVVIGLASNPLIPIAVRRIEAWAETFGGK